MAADPEPLFRLPDPWPIEVTDAALALIGSGHPARGAPAHTPPRSRCPGAAGALPSRSGRLAEEQAAVDRVDWSSARIVRDALAALDRTVYLRLEIARAFADPASGAP